jgi:uncharacterized protein YggU (UPF0235/DUF167 family)
VLHVRVIPRAGSSRISGFRDGALLIRLAAAPADGAANEALTALLAKTLAIPVRSIAISSGLRSRNKRITVRADLASVRQRLADVLKEST